MAELPAMVSRLTASPFGLALAVILAIAAADAGLRWWVRRRRLYDGNGGHAPPLNNSRRWVGRTMSAVLHPLVLLLWVHGAYLVGLLLTEYLREDTWRQPLIAAANGLYGIAVAVALAFAGIGRGNASDAAGALDTLLVESAVRISSADWRRAAWRTAGSPPIRVSGSEPRSARRRYRASVSRESA